MIKGSAKLFALAALAGLATPGLAAGTKSASAPATTPVSTPANASVSAPANPPATSRSSNAIQTPMDDLNLRKEALAPALQQAVDRPYSLEGLAQCSQLVAAVDALNTALGKDIDLPQESGSRLTASDLVNFAASSVIPFRDVIRQVSGASNRQRQAQEAVLAGFARRSFLKGVGKVRNCAYPARPASPQIIAAQAAALMASLEQLCGPLPNGQKRSTREEWLISRKCASYRRAKAEATAAAPVTGATRARSN